MHKHLKFVSTVGMSHEEWLERRKKTIGGSDSAAVVGLNAYSSPYSLWAEKSGKVPGFGGNLATEVGTYMEEFIAKKFEKESGKRVRRLNAIIYNPDYPFAHVNIDRDVVGEDSGLECKHTDSLNMKKFKNGEYPENYYVQCVHSMAITGCKRWYLAVLIGNKEFKWFTIERDEDEIAALMAAEEEFWKCVTENRPPEADGHKSTTETIKTIFAESNDENVSLFGYEDCLKQYLALGKQIKELETLKDEMANKVKSFMGTAGKGESDNYKVSWTTSVKKAHYVNESVSRTFRVTEKK